MPISRSSVLPFSSVRWGLLLLVPVIPVWNVEDPSSNYCDRNVLGRSLNCSEVQEKRIDLLFPSGKIPLDFHRFSTLQVAEIPLLAR
jgi:hypothetical protein